MDAREADSLTDALVRQAGRGEQDAIARVLDILHGDLAVLIRQAHINTSDRDDASQDAVLVVMACAQSFDPQLGTFRAYVHVSVRKMLRKFHHLGPILLAAVPDLPYEARDVELEAVDVIGTATHPEIVRDYFGIGRPELSVNQIAARRRMAPRRVQAALTESLQVMRETS